jgi:hypothetical protein
VIDTPEAIVVPSAGALLASIVDSVQMAHRQNAELHMIGVAEDVPRQAELIAEL